MKRFDVLVIGAGTAGTYAAKAAKQHASAVGVVEQGVSGGDCIYNACIPTKALVHAARAWKTMKGAGFFGLDVPSSSTADYRQVKAFKDRIVASMARGRDEAFGKKGIELMKGRARFISAHEVAVGEESVQAEKIVIATGSLPAVPPVPGLKEAGFLTNIEALKLDHVPQRLAIIGGGPVGAEFAQIFSSFGASVSIFEMSDRVLPGEDADVSAAIGDLFRKQGVSVATGVKMTGVKMTGVEARPSGKALTIEEGGKARMEEFDELLVATGRRPGIEGLGLEAAGVASSKRGVTISPSMQTNVPHIFAAGDVAGTALFTPVAWEQGDAAGWNATHAEQRTLDYSILPHVVFCDPEVAGVGLTEAAARDKGIETKIGKYSFSSLTRAIVADETEGFIKIVADGSTGAIVGGWVVGVEASTLIHEVAAAMSRRLTLRDIGNTFHAYPTFSEGIRYACQAIG